jgi:hypothetical protein
LSFYPGIFFNGLRVAGAMDEIGIQNFPNPTSLLGGIRHSVKLQALRETTRNFRRNDVPAEYKSDSVLLDLMSPDRSVK